MDDTVSKQSSGVLSPVERISEVLFGLIMVLTFTGSLSAATAGHEEVRDMLVAALGCNLAWGLIDALLYLMASFIERGRGMRMVEAVHNAAHTGEVKRIIAEALPPLLASLMRSSDFEYLREKLIQIPLPSAGAVLTKQDLRGAIGVFLLVFFSIFPVVIPFTFMHDPIRALRVSNVVAVTMLFGAGYALGRYSGHRPFFMGMSTMIIGIVLVSVTIALGG
jgi:hypothetical protein